MEQNLDHANYNHIHYLDKMNLLTRDPYILRETAFIDETFYNMLTMKSGTVASLMRKFINIVKAFVIFSRKTRNELTNSDPLMMKNLLEKEAWRLILLNSQKHHPFKILAKYNIIKIQGVLSKLTTNDARAISLLGTDATPVISNKDHLAKLLIHKAHLRQIHSSLKQIHSTAAKEDKKEEVQCKNKIIRKSMKK